MSRRAALVAGALAVPISLCAIAGTAGADESAAARRAAAAREMDRPYTMAELGVGLLTLPAADVCIRSVKDCEQGETSVGVGIQNLYRYHSIGFGAGIMYATTLRSDAARGDVDLDHDGELDLGRDHARKYFLVEGLFRYYALRTGSWEWWGGVTIGGVIVNDSWSTNSDREPYADTAFVGPRAATIGTEGVTAGLAIGGEWTFASNWSFGTVIRYSSWFLPSTPERSPTGDIASLNGRVDMFDLGLAIAYRIAL